LAEERGAVVLVSRFVFAPLALGLAGLFCVPSDSPFSRLREKVALAKQGSGEGSWDLMEFWGYGASVAISAISRKIRRIISERGGKCMHRELVQSIKHAIKTRDKKELLESLMHSGDIVKLTDKPKGGKEVVSYRLIRI